MNPILDSANGQGGVGRVAITGLSPTANKAFIAGVSAAVSANVRVAVLGITVKFPTVVHSGPSNVTVGGLCYGAVAKSTNFDTNQFFEFAPISNSIENGSANANASLALVKGFVGRADTLAAAAFTAYSSVVVHWGVGCTLDFRDDPIYLTGNSAFGVYCLTTNAIMLAGITSAVVEYAVVPTVMGV